MIVNNISCALLLVGHIRDSLNNDILSNALSEFKKSFIRCDIFVHTWATYEANSIMPLHALYDTKLGNEAINENDLLSYINPTKYIIEKQDESLLNDNEEYFFMCKVPRVSMKFIYYSIWKAYTLSKTYSEENNIKYDIVIRIRPDFYKFPYTANINNLKQVITEIKKYKNMKNYITGFFHRPDTALGDNYFFLHYEDGDIFLKAINNDYSTICDENGCISQEEVMHICLNNLKFKSIAAIPKGSYPDFNQWVKKNNVTKRLICSFLDKIKNAIDKF